MKRSLHDFLTISYSKIYPIKPYHHFIFWFIYFVFNTLRWGSYYDDYLLSLKGNLLGFPIHISLCYFAIYFLIPRMLARKSFILYPALLLLVIFLMVIVKFWFTYFLISNNVWPEGPETSTLTFNYIVQMMLGEVYVISFVTAIKITIDYLFTYRKASELEKSQLEMELKFLRTQINPHFFFNTLNNIYSLSLENSKSTPEAIMKLSELMRYILYETKDQRQSLKNEIKTIKNYLDLEKLRHGNKLDILFTISGDISQKKISPMLLIPFVENAFKHGVNKNIGKVKIEINLTVEGNQLLFEVINPVPDKRNIQNKENISGGIGIENVKKRLQLSYDKTAYKLEILENESIFKIKLNLTLE